MAATLPIKNLIRLTWLLALAICVITGLFLLLLEVKGQLLTYAVLTGVIIAVIGHVNTWILIKLERRFGRDGEKFKLYRYVTTYPVSIAVYLLSSPTFAYFSRRHWSYREMSNIYIFVFAGILMNTLFIILQDFMLLQNEKANAELEISNLKAAHAEAANLLLKQQIHPHFLFNALNTLKALYRTDAAAGDTYLVHLANFLRASVLNNGSKLSKLREEVELLQDYLEMQKIRFGSALECTITIPEKSLQTYYLPPFSLQPLLENALKHNNSTELHPLRVSIFQDQDRIVVQNNLRKKKINIPSASSGLANLTERYRILSGDEVIIKEEKDFFLVSIKLLTNEDSNHRRREVSRS